MLLGERRGEVPIEIIDFKKFLKESANSIGIHLASEPLNMFEVYKNVLKEWNTSRVNLTSIEDDEGIVFKHFIDSLVFSKAFKISDKEFTLLDLGSGAGFPGVPIKIAFRNVQLTLVDSQKKRALFLAVLLPRLGLSNINIFNSRGEELSRDVRFREQFDFVTMREFGKVPLNIEIGLPFVKVGGYLVLWKGEKDLAEFDKYKELISELGASLEEIYPYNLNDSIKRYIVKVKKGWVTPKKYPRSFATIIRSIKKNAC